jgi:hypothetical protein
MESLREKFLRALPARPYCTNQLGYRLSIRDKEKAAEFAMIQHNSPLVWGLMVFDIDGDDAYTRAEDRGCPPPTFIALNRDNGHGHAAYLLEAPVSAYAKSSIKAMRYFEDVERGYINRLGADRSYPGFLCKNPLSPRWETDWQSVIPYRLDTLNDYLEKSDKRRIRNAEPLGVGRNITMFDAVRKFAYKHCLEFKKNGQDLGDFFSLLQEVADATNRTFIPHLSYTEVKGITRSVAKWVWNRFSVERFSQIQRLRACRRWANSMSLTTTKPWAAEGICRRTWERRHSKSQLKLLS